MSHSTATILIWTLSMRVRVQRIDHSQAYKGLGQLSMLSRRFEWQHARSKRFDVLGLVYQTWVFVPCSKVRGRLESSVVKR